MKLISFSDQKGLSFLSLPTEKSEPAVSSWTTLWFISLIDLIFECLLDICMLSSVYDVLIGSGAAALGIIACFLAHFLAQCLGGVCRRVLWM